MANHRLLSRTPPLHFEKQIVRIPLHRRMDSEKEQPPIQPNENDLLADAQIVSSFICALHIQ